MRNRAIPSLIVVAALATFAAVSFAMNNRRLESRVSELESQLRFIGPIEVPPSMMPRPPWWKAFIIAPKPPQEAAWRIIFTPAALVDPHFPDRVKREIEYLSGPRAPSVPGPIVIMPSGQNDPNWIRNRTVPRPMDAPQIPTQ